MLGLANLPVLVPAASFEFLAEASSLVDQWFVRGGTGQKAPHPSDDMGRGLFPYQPSSEDELAELLKR